MKNELTNIPQWAINITNILNKSILNRTGVDDVFRVKEIYVLIRKQLDG